MIEGRTWGTVLRGREGEEGEEGRKKSRGGREEEEGEDIILVIGSSRNLHVVLPYFRWTSVWQKDLL